MKPCLPSSELERSTKRGRIEVEQRQHTSMRCTTAAHSGAYLWSRPSAPIREQPSGSGWLTAPAKEPRVCRAAASGDTSWDLAQLSQQQRAVVEAALGGENIFFTGMPGTGKSFTLCVLIEALREQLQECELAVCASTGAAACHIGGGTVHSFLNCGLGQQPNDFDRMTRAQERLLRTKVLVIDEISMLSGDFFQQASAALCKLRGRDTAFGGLQVILSGDFMQLPPVSGPSQQIGVLRFAFQAPCWAELNLVTFERTQNFRQAKDRAFQAILHRIRLGELLDADRAVLIGCGIAANSEADRQTTLYCRNVDVERQNAIRLAQLPGHSIAFHAEDSFVGMCGSFERLLEKSTIPRDLFLKVGARVMLLKNLRTPQQCQQDEVPLVNGSVGIVVTFQAAQGTAFPVVDFGGHHHPVQREHFSGSIPGMGTWNRCQLPLRLAWAISVHKSQGMTLEGGVVDLSSAFEEGQVYVALSRFRSAQGLVVRGLPSQLRVSPLAKQFHEEISSARAAGDGAQVSRCPNLTNPLEAHKKVAQAALSMPDRVLGRLLLAPAPSLQARVP